MSLAVSCRSWCILAMWKLGVVFIYFSTSFTSSSHKGAEPTPLKYYGSAAAVLNGRVLCNPILVIEVLEERFKDTMRHTSKARPNQSTPTNLFRRVLKSTCDNQSKKPRHRPYDCSMPTSSLHLAHLKPSFKTGSTKFQRRYSPFLSRPNFSGS